MHCLEQVPYCKYDSGNTLCGLQLLYYMYVPTVAGQNRKQVIHNIILISINVEGEHMYMQSLWRVNIVIQGIMRAKGCLLNFMYVILY